MANSTKYINVQPCTSWFFNKSFSCSVESNKYFNLDANRVKLFVGFAKACYNNNPEEARNLLSDFSTSSNPAKRGECPDIFLQRNVRDLMIRLRDGDDSAAKVLGSIKEIKDVAIGYGNPYFQNADVEYPAYECTQVTDGVSANGKPYHFEKRTFRHIREAFESDDKTIAVKALSTPESREYAFAYFKRLVEFDNENRTVVSVSCKPRDVLVAEAKADGVMRKIPSEKALNRIERFMKKYIKEFDEFLDRETLYKERVYGNQDDNRPEFIPELEELEKLAQEQLDSCKRESPVHAEWVKESYEDSIDSARWRAVRSFRMSSDILGSISKICKYADFEYSDSGARAWLSANKPILFKLVNESEKICTKWLASGASANDVFNILAEQSNKSDSSEEIRAVVKQLSACREDGSFNVFANQLLYNMQLITKGTVRFYEKAFNVIMSDDGFATIGAIDTEGTAQLARLRKEILAGDAADRFIEMELDKMSDDVTDSDYIRWATSQFPTEVADKLVSDFEELDHGLMPHEFFDGYVPYDGDNLMPNTRFRRLICGAAKMIVDAGQDAYDAFYDCKVYAIYDDSDAMLKAQQALDAYNASVEEYNNSSTEDERWSEKFSEIINDLNGHCIGYQEIGIQNGDLDDGLGF